MRTVFFTGFLAGWACLAAGGDDVPTAPPAEPEAPASVEISLAGAAEHSVEVRLVPDGNAVSCSWAIGGAGEAAAFAAGTLEGTETAQGNSPRTVLFGDLDDGASYTVYASAVNADGRAGEVAALKVVHIRRGLYESIGDEGVADLLDEAPFGWHNHSYTDIFAADRGDNVCSFAVPYNANGAEGRAAEVYFYEFSLEQGVQVNAPAAAVGSGRG